MLIIHFELLHFSFPNGAASFERIFELIQAYNLLTRHMRKFNSEPVAQNLGPQYSVSPSFANQSMNTPLYSQSVEQQVQYGHGHPQAPDSFGVEQRSQKEFQHFFDSQNPRSNRDSQHFSHGNTSVDHSTGKSSFHSKNHKMY